MLADIVKAVIASEDDLELVDEIAGIAGLAQAACKAQADVLIVGGALDGSYSLTILYGAPRLKIVAIDADGRHGVLHELRPSRTLISEISPATLVAAVRGATGASQLAGNA
jgi:hypothetical protein